VQSTGRQREVRVSENIAGATAMGGKRGPFLPATVRTGDYSTTCSGNRIKYEYKFRGHHNMGGLRWSGNVTHEMWSGNVWRYMGSAWELQPHHFALKLEKRCDQRLLFRTERPQRQDVRNPIRYGCAARILKDKTFF